MTRRKMKKRGGVVDLGLRRVATKSRIRARK
jgi:hypothetical protein